MIQINNTMEDFNKRTYEIKRRIFMDRMEFEISALINDIFSPEEDPEVLRKTFREYLTYWKINDRESYNRCLGTDAD